MPGQEQQILDPVAVGFGVPVLVGVFVGVLVGVLVLVFVGTGVVGVLVGEGAGV